MKILLLYIGKTTESYLIDGIATYVRRLSNYIAVKEAVVPASVFKDKRRAQEEEENQIARQLLTGDFVVALDERGKQLSSTELAGQAEQWMSRSIKRVVFVVGGAYGFSKTFLENADFLLSLSKLTFTHQMVRLVLAEQLYRAMTIIRNEKYHHG